MCLQKPCTLIAKWTRIGIHTHTNFHPDRITHTHFQLRAHASFATITAPWICTFWNVLAAALRHSFYFESEHSPFLVCVALYQVSLQFREEMFADNSASSMQVGDGGNLLATKTFTMSFRVQHSLCDPISPGDLQQPPGASHRPVREHRFFPSDCRLPGSWQQLWLMP